MDLIGIASDPNKAVSGAAQMIVLGTDVIIKSCESTIVKSVAEERATRWSNEFKEETATGTMPSGRAD